MAEQIKKSDIVQGNPFTDIGKEIEAALKQLERFDSVAKSTAKTLSSDLSQASKKTVQDINAINQAEKESEKLMQEKVRTMKLEQQLLVEQEKVKQAQLRTEQQLAKANEKNVKAMQDQNNAYKQLEKSTREYKNQSKQLGAELLKLEADGKKNTEQYRKLAVQYRDVTKAAQQGDAQLKKLDKTVGDNFRNVGNYQSAIGGLKSALGTLGVAFGATQLVSFGRESVELFRVQQKAIAQVEAGLKSTGEQAGFTSQQLQEMASALQKQTLFGDEVILKDATAQLLTFTNISGEQFARTQEAALDLATRLDGDLKSASIQLGKALNDPVANLSALSRSGIQFSKEQKETINALVETNRLADAQTLILDELNKQYGGSAEAAAKADGGITQLANAWGDAKELLGGLIVDAIKPATQGLLDFFSSITLEDVKGFISTIGRLLKVFIAYKAVMFSLKMADRIKEMIAYNKAVKDGSIAAGGASEGVKKFGAALKSVGFGIAIGLALELAKAMYDIASGAAEARRNQDLLNRTREHANKVGEAAVTREKAIYDEGIRQLDLEIRKRLANAKTESERKKIEEERVKRETELAKVAQASFNNEIKRQNLALKTLETRKEEIKQLPEMIKTTERLDGVTTVVYNKNLERERQLNAINEAILRQKAVLGTLIHEQRNFNNVVDEAVVSEEEYNVKVKDNSDVLKRNTKDKEDNNKQTARAVELLEREGAARESLFDADELERMLLLDEERAVVMADIAVTEAEIALAKAQQTGDAMAIAQAEERLTKAKIDAINAQLKLDLATETDPAKRVLLEKNAEKDILALNQNVIESYKERYDTINQVQQAITDVLQEQIDKRIDLLKQEADAAKSQQDYLEDLAANGNITAQQSIAEQIQIQREAQAEQMRLEKQKQQIELISQGLSTFNAELGAGKSPAEALASTIVSTQALVGFLRNLNFYEKGTDYAPGGLAVVDEKGAEIITDSRGRIKDIGTGEGARFVNLDRGDKVITATKTAQILNAFGGVANASIIGKGKDHAGNGYDIMKLNGTLKEIKSAIKNKPEYNVHWDTFGTVERVRRGGDVVTNRYRVK